MLVARGGAGDVAREPLQALREKSAATHREFEALKRFLGPRTVFLHVGAGDCVLAMQAAAYVERVYAIDPAEAVLHRRRLPLNLRAVFAGPGGLGVQGGTAHVAYSETLRAERLRDIARALVPGGAYLFHPQRIDRARKLRAQLLEAGFSAVRFPALFFLRKELVAAVR